MFDDPFDTRYIKLARTVFRRDNAVPKMGWTHAVYFDTESKHYIIADFPEEGKTFTTTLLLPGDATLTMRGVSHNVTVRE